MSLLRRLLGLRWTRCIDGVEYDETLMRDYFDETSNAGASVPAVMFMRVTAEHYEWVRARPWWKVWA